ncbi:AMP-binding protein [Brevibacterium litoralis]|uniref:AMP-binding protein n=1 Tax=Brevibacterium litoralis TaxID=3138935 RepID=UPI0032EBF699
MSPRPSLTDTSPNPDLQLMALATSPSPVARMLRHAHQIPEDAAIRYRGGTTSWSALAHQVLDCAAWMRARGVGAGDRIALVLTNRADYIVLTLAASALGAITVPVNFRLTSGEVAYIVDRTRPVLVFCEEPTREVTRKALGQGASTLHDVDESPVDTGDLAAGAPLAPEEVFVPTSADDFCILHTSGTTGHPKGAVLSYGTVYSSGNRNAARWTLGEGPSTAMLASPMFHVGAFMSFLTTVMGGATALVVPSAGFDPAATLQLMKSEQVTAAFLVPQQWQLVCDAIAAQGEAGRAGLTIQHPNWGGAPASPTLLQQMKELMPDAQIRAVFGQTETAGTAVTLSYEDSLERPSSVGLPVEDTWIRVVGPDMVDVERGQVGEIVYRGNCVMSRYWDDEEATARAFDGGWFHSGDLVRQDEDGYVYVVDRLKDMIISGGENIYCAEIENALAWHPQVGEVTVVGRPDPRWGEVPVACVVPVDAAAPPDLAGVREFLGDRLASYKHPKEIRVLTEIPRTSMGKIHKVALREDVKDDALTAVEAP